MPITSFTKSTQNVISSISKMMGSNATKDNPRYVFQYNIELTFVSGDGQTEKIDQNFVRYVMFDYEYELNSIPVIYVSFSATNEIYDLIMENERYGKVFFSLYRDNKYSDSSLSVKTVSGEFSYIPSTANMNYTENLDTEVSADNSYKEITIALISESLLNFTKLYNNRVFKNIDTNTLLGIIFEKMTEVGQVIIKAPKYSVDLEHEILPPMSTIKTYLSYLFNQAPFYDTDFVFFLDFDRCYLLDKNGEGCELSDGTLHTVIFEINEATNSQAYYEGLEVDESSGAYIVYINPADANASLNRSQDRVANRLVVVGEDGYDEEMDVGIDVNSTAFSEDKIAFVRGTDAVLLKNIMESNTVFFTVEKPYIDANVFTPNKKYMVSNYGNDYNGEYTLAFKKEIISNNGGTFNESSEFGLRKVGNITETGGAGAQKASEGSKSKYYSNNDISTNGKVNTSNAPRNTNSSNYTVRTVNNPRGYSTMRSSNVVAGSRYTRKMLDVSGPSRTIKATQQHPNLMRKLNK